MRFLLLISAFFLATTASTQEIYKTVDEDGNVQYTDNPPTDEATPEKLPDVIYQPAVRPTTRLSPEETQTPALSAIEVSLTSPQNEDTILGSASSIPVSGQINRPLGELEFSQLVVNGQPYGPFGKSLSWNVGDLVRGEYRLQIRILQNDQVMASSGTVVVYVRRNIAR